MRSYISSIGTAVPDNKLSQHKAAEFMLRHLDLSDEQAQMLKVLYRASGIKFRHSVIGDFGRVQEAFTFFPKSKDLEPFPTVKQRMTLYQREAIKLAEAAVHDCMDRNKQKEITHLITVSCTGMYAPGLDIDLLECLELPTDTSRTAINFMGCYASFNALKVADRIVRSEPNATVLIVSVELCSIHLLKNTDPDGLLSNTLFGDGAAAVLVEGKRNEHIQFAMETFHADLDLDGRNEMSWNIGDFGFEMKLSLGVPEIIRKGIGQLTSRLLGKLNLDVEDMDYFAIHPGGKKILEVIEEELGIAPTHNQPAYDVLRDYGNMSSPTILFVLKRILNQLDPSKDNDKRLLSFAFGPGLTMESMLLKIHGS